MDKIEHTNFDNFQDRENALRLIEEECTKFHVPIYLQEIMADLLPTTLATPMDTAALAVFLIVTRMGYLDGDIINQITFKRLSDSSKVDKEEIYQALLEVEKKVPLQVMMKARQGAFSSRISNFKNSFSYFVNLIYLFLIEL